MLTLEHKEILRDIRLALDMEQFDDLLEDDAKEKFENILNKVEEEYIAAGGNDIKPEYGELPQ